MANLELIEARKVAEILKMSIPSLRDYKKHGLIVVAAKRGNTDLYDKADVVKRFSFIREKRSQGFSLSQISLMLKKEPASAVNDQEQLHGFLTELYLKASPETKAYVDDLCRKWNVRIQV
jgi:DNA-binding transcriptional MerR regulator